MIYYEEDLPLEIVVADIDYPPAPHGGRAAFGTAVGLAVGALAASAWARLAHGVWDPNRLTLRSERLKTAGWLLAGSVFGAAMAARPSTRRRAIAGAAVGNLVAQLPVLLDPELIANNPVVGNIWQFGLPIAGAVIAINLEPPP